MDTTALAPVLQHTGPFASVLVDVSQDTGGGRHQHDLHVREACEELASQGAPAEVVEALTERLGEVTHRPAPSARFVVATPEGVALDEVVPVRVDRARASWASLPDLATYAALRDSATRFVLVVVDHEGGEVSLHDSDLPWPEEERTVESPDADTAHVRKVTQGDWAHPQFQRTAENTWRRNADAVVDEVSRLVDEGAELVLLTGDPTSVGMVRRGLEHSSAEVVELPTGQRTEDGGDEALWDAVRQALHVQVVARRLALSERLEEAIGRGDAAAVGASAVADAFVTGRVETLALDPALAATEEVDLDQHPGLALGPATSGTVPADRALVAAAVATDADVVPLPAVALGGHPVAALLRWTD